MLVYPTLLYVECPPPPSILPESAEQSAACKLASEEDHEVSGVCSVYKELYHSSPRIKPQQDMCQIPLRTNYLCVYNYMPLYWNGD